MTDILTDEWLKDFFSAVDDNNIIKRRESNYIEFKSVFDWQKESSRAAYCKSLAAFSNNGGGALFFGIENKPHKVIGVNNFENIDDADITNYINEIFTPHIQFERRKYDYKGMTIGILYSSKSKSRPVICSKDTSKTFSSDIYFRYSAKSTKIKAGDLIKLIQDVKDEESNKWLKLLENIGKIGVENTHLLNSQSGEILSDNNTFLLDEDLLKQIKIIDKYSIQENGQPAVRIIGNIPELARVIKKSSVLYEEDLYKEFLNNKHDFRAEELLRFACQKKTSSYPFYFLFKRMKLSSEQGKSFLESTKITGTTRKSYIQRIEKDERQIKSKNRFSLSSKTPNGIPRALYLHNFHNLIEFEIGSVENSKRILESVFSLEKGQYDIEFVKKKIFEVFEAYFPFDKSLNNYLFRDAVTYLDYLEK